MTTTRVLLVEDEEMLAELLAETIRESGFDVTVSNTGGGALELLEGVARFDILVTDANLPGVNGASLAKRFRELRPDGRICLISGHLDAEQMFASQLSGEKAKVLIKPFPSRELVDWLAKTIVR